MDRGIGVFVFLMGELVTAVFLAVAALGVVVVFLRLPEGRALLLAEAEQAARNAGIQLKMEGLSGSVPFDWRLDRLSVADEDGRWLDATGIYLLVDVQALFDRRLVVTRVGAERIRLDRLPGGRGGSGDEPVTAPAPPLPIRIDSATIDEISVSEAVAGRLLSLRAEARAEADPAAEGARGRLRLEGMGGFIDTGWELTAATLRLPDALARLGENRIDAPVEVTLTDGLVSGRVTAALGDLGALAALAGQTAAGRATLDVTLGVEAGTQSVALSATGRGLSAGGTSVAEVTAKADLRDLRGHPNGSADANAAGLAFGGTALKSVELRFEGGMDAASVTAKVTGGAPDTPDAEAEVRMARAGSETTFRLERLSARYRGETARLREPATLTLGPDRARLSSARIEALGSAITAEGGFEGEAIAARLRAEGVALSLVQRFIPGLAIDGRGELTARLGGTRATPSGELTATVRGVSVAAATEAGAPPVDARVEGHWRDGRLTATGTAATTDRSFDLRLDGALPLRLDPDTMVPAIPADARLEARARGTAQAALLNTLLAAGGDRAAGTLRFDLTANGPLTGPRFGGTAALDGGRYENRESGAVLTGITARINASGDTVRLDQLRGQTPGGGTLTASGTFRPMAPGQPLAFTIAARNAQIAARDIATASADADLRLAGPLTSPELSGTVRVRRVDVRIPDRLPPQIVDLKVEVAHGAGSFPLPRRKPAPAGAGSEAGGPSALRLNVGVDANARVFIRGRGLDAEIGGRLRAEGTADAPRLTGQLHLIQGRLELLGRSFAFDRFNVVFDGTNPPDPRLDVQAKASGNNVSVLVLVGGTASNPTLQLTSPEGLPQDEALSRVLFGKSVAVLGAGEAVQLASSIADLSGVGGGDLSGRLRRSLGLDRLQFTSGASGGSVAAGRYVSDRVYVGVRQSIGGESAAEVQVDITDNIKAEAQVGATGGSRVGVTFEWEY
jgi:translocation and assembly module TamB